MAKCSFTFCDGEIVNCSYPIFDGEMVNCSSPIFDGEKVLTRLLEIFSRSKYFIVSNSFLIYSCCTLLPRSLFRRNFLNIMPRQEPVGAIRQPSKSGIVDDDVFEFIRCVGGLLPKIHEFWTFGEDVITPEVRPFACVDVSAFVRDYFVTNYLTENGRRVPMFGRKLINGSFERMGVPDFLRADGPPWTVNLLLPYADWGRRGPSTNQKFSSGSGGFSDSVHINWNRPDCDLPIYHQRVF